VRVTPRRFFGGLQCASLQGPKEVQQGRPMASRSQYWKAWCTQLLKRG